MNEIYEVLKQYECAVEGLDFMVRGKILKSISAEKYRWDVSHHCKQLDEKIQAYRPAKHARTAQDAQRYLLDYLQRFTCLAVEENPLYNCNNDRVSLPSP